jgi:transcriptional regulator with XRE-family HTH domain
MDPLRADLWDDPEVAEALVSRDIAHLFRFLQRRGVSQRRIAAHTGQAQSEISEILAGRTVTSYPVLERIALGLGIPRGRLGLAYDKNPCPMNQPPITRPSLHERPAGVRPRPAHDIDLTAEVRSAEPVLTGTGTDINAIVRAVLAATPVARQGDPVTTIGLWSGLHVRALRESMRMSVRAFAEYLGLSDRMISKWEAGGANIQPRPVNQAALDTCFDRLEDDARQRFTAHLGVVAVTGAYVATDRTTKAQPRRRSQSTSTQRNREPEQAESAAGRKV